MTYEGHIESGKVVFDEPAPLAEGTRVRIEVAPDVSAVSDDIPTIAEQLASVIGKAEGLPADWSENHDKYLCDEHRQ